MRRLRTTAEALDLNRICDLWHAYLGPAAAQGSGPALARRRRPIASSQHGEQREHEHQPRAQLQASASADTIRGTHGERIYLSIYLSIYLPLLSKTFHHHTTHIAPPGPGR